MNVSGTRRLVNRQFDDLLRRRVERRAREPLHGGDLRRRRAGVVVGEAIGVGELEGIAAREVHVATAQVEELCGEGEHARRCRRLRKRDTNPERNAG